MNNLTLEQRIEDLERLFSERFDVKELTSIAEEEKVKFKEGDWVQYITKFDYDVGFTLGNVYKLNLDEDGDFLAKDDDGDDSFLSSEILSDSFQLASQEELPFLRAGREVGEYRVGDIVEVVYGLFVKILDVGKTIITDIDGSSFDIKDIKLVAPVENQV